MRRSPQTRRRGFTLIELIVVVALIGILATMLFFSFPSFSGQNTVSSAADRIVGALLIARQRAKRDGRVTGLRVSQDATGAWTVLQYVQQPDDFVIANLPTDLLSGTIATMGQTPINPPGIPKAGYKPLGWTPPGQPMANTIFLNRRNTNPVSNKFIRLLPDFGSDDTVLPGDFIEIYGGGPVHQIVAVNSPKQATIPFESLTVFGTNLQPPFPATPSPLPPTPSVVGPVTYTSAAPNYRIIRQPRLLSGEAPITLPTRTGLDFSVQTIGGTATALTNLLPTQIAPAPGWITAPELPPAPASLYCDILFTPSGAVTGQGASTGQLYLWVRDLSVDNSTNIVNGWPVIVAVQMTTGFISSQQANDPNDPFAITRDGRGAGS